MRISQLTHTTPPSRPRTEKHKTPQFPTSCFSQSSHKFSLLCTLGLSGFFATVQSQLFPAQFDLTDLNGTNGFIIDYGGTRLGSTALANAGDLNGDGIADLILGERFATPAPTRENAGITFVVFGKRSWPQRFSVGNDTAGILINGEKNTDHSGSFLSTAGDLNGDGFVDLITTAVSVDPAPGREDAGRVYVIFGGPSLKEKKTIELSELNGTNGFMINGINAGDRISLSSASNADLNNDGFSDLVIGGQNADLEKNTIDSGAVYVLFGGPNLGKNHPIELSSLKAPEGFVILGEAEKAFTGRSVSLSGDVNADGIADLIIGAPGAPSSGKVYVIFGNSELKFTDVLRPSQLNGTNGFVINGEDSDSQCGVSVSSNGDVNDDGIADIIIGAHYATLPSNRTNAGRTYVLFGKSNLGEPGIVELSNRSYGFVIDGQKHSDFSGFPVTSNGDLNGDGVSDIVIGAHRVDPQLHLHDAGSVYIIFGKKELGSTGAVELSRLNGTNGFTINAILAKDIIGSSIACEGDINGDGVTDLLIGSYWETTNNSEIFAIFGRKSQPVFPPTFPTKLTSLQLSVSSTSSTSIPISSLVSRMTTMTMGEIPMSSTFVSPGGTSTTTIALISVIIGLVLSLGASIGLHIYGRRKNEPEEQDNTQLHPVYANVPSQRSSATKEGAGHYRAPPTLQRKRTEADYDSWSVIEEENAKY